MSKSEYVTIRGRRKHRMRCPKCGRAAPDDFCMVHGDVKAVDVKRSKKAMRDTLALMDWLEGRNNAKA
ncbi:MAG: hypothetical protein ABIH23_20170 [bacterium]